MSSMFPCISDSPSRTNVLTIIFLLVAPRCRDVCNVCQHEWWAVGSTRVASTRGMPLSMHISPSLLPSFARPCQDHEELIGAFLLSCAPSSGTSAASSGIGGGGGGGGGDDDSGSGGGDDDDDGG